MLWDNLPFKAGLTRDMRVLAVDGAAWSAERLRDALIAAKTAKPPVELLLCQGDSFTTQRIDYHGGGAIRISNASDRLRQVLAAW